MSLSPTDARSALDDIARTEARSAEAFRGKEASPFLILWGVIWIIGYGATAINETYAMAWMGLGPLGGVASFAIGFVQRARNKRDSAQGDSMLISLGVFLSIFAFFTAALAILAPVNGYQISAFVPLVIALLYCLMGLFGQMPRMMALGVLLMGLTAGGYFLLHDYFFAWMAIVGGAGLILGGLWLRTV
jgi:hypothetical protein